MKTILAVLFAVWSVCAMAESGYILVETTTSGRCNDEYGKEVDCMTQIAKPTQPIIRFNSNGEIIWKGHKVESDAELRAAVIDFIRYLNNPSGYCSKGE